LWENRYREDIGNVCLVSVDGTDFRIQEPTHFWKGWHSRKFNGPGLRYEVAISICSGDIVWIHGPFPCGHWPDIKIFRHALIYELEEGEKVEADKGYRGEAEHASVPDCNVFLSQVGRRQKALARSRHETVNKRLKQWHCLHDTFRHDLTKHGSIFRAVAVIVQVTIENGEPLFAVDYNDRQHY
jgi:DDE superfamily endonuclease